MDGKQFDAFARALARGSSRRSLLKGMGGLFGVAVGLAGAGGAAAGPAPRKCKNNRNGSSCRGNDECCDGYCHAPCSAGQTRDATCACIPAVPGSACSSTQPCPDLGNRCWPDVCVEASCTQLPLDCEDGNPCTDAFCSDTEGCQYPAKPAGLECPGGFCDAQGTCRPACASAADCPAPPAGERCLIAVCETGVCNLQGNPCDDGNPCTDGFCSETDGCQYIGKSPGVECPGGFCDGQGTCRPICVSAADCPRPPAGEKCLVAVCESGICNLRGKDCNTGNPCTDDSCVEGTGCVSNPGPHIGTPCLDEGICNKRGVCVVD
jgi:hypothetical protein